MSDRDDGGGWWPERGDKRKREEGGGEEVPKPRGLASRGGRAQPPSRYSMFVGLAFFALILVALFNLIGDDDAGILGVGADKEGLPLAEFAAPDAFGTSDADANVFQDDCESSRNPCPEEQQRTPACEIDPGEAIRVCDLFDKPLAISFWFTRGGDCIPTQDAFDRVAQRYEERVNFLSMNVRDDREEVAGIAERNGWDVPVGLDPDGAVSNLYRVGVCPTIVLAYPGGILYDAEVQGGNYDVADIDGFVADLLDASRQRAARSR
jgi:thiol-disulfide isomerase/thioredoxin